MTVSMESTVPPLPKGPLQYADVEIIRGFAALAVVVYHFLCAFLPPAAAPEIADAMGVVAERPLLIAFVNGHFMVALFFVLSSFALTARIVREGGRRNALVAIVKRFPRLLPLTLIGTLLPAFLLAIGLMINGEAAQISGSVWLDRSGGIKEWGSWPEPSFLGAIADAILLFERGLSQYNSALWTMKYELLGSLLALATAFVIGPRHRPRTDALLVILVALLALDIHALCATCVLAVYLTKYIALSPPRLAPSTSMALILMGLALGSTFKPFPPELTVDGWMRLQVIRADWLIHGCGAMLLFAGLRCLAPALLQNLILGKQLGQLSFAIYVLHVPLQGSLASAIIVGLGYSVGSVLLAFAVSMSALFLIAVPVARFDGWWVRQLNGMARRITRSRPMPQPPSNLAP